MFIPTDYQREVSLYVNGSYKGVCFESDNHNIKDLGKFEKGEEVTVKLVLKKSDLYIREPQFAVYNEEAETAAIAQMHEKNAETKVEKVSQTDITQKATIYCLPLSLPKRAGRYMLTV